jgi:hypothetical protein
MDWERIAAQACGASMEMTITESFGVMLKDTRWTSDICVVANPLL